MERRTNVHRQKDRSMDTDGQMDEDIQTDRKTKRGKTT